MGQTIIVDFDGVINSYKTGWSGADVILDPPVSGAIEWLNDMAIDFKIAILSARSTQEGGIEAMKSYVLDNGVHTYFIENGDIFFPTEKVPSIMSIDDRGFRFNGTFPSKLEIDNFQPWHKDHV